MDMDVHLLRGDPFHRNVGIVKVLVGPQDAFRLVEPALVECSSRLKQELIHYRVVASDDVQAIGDPVEPLVLLRIRQVEDVRFLEDHVLYDIVIVVRP